MRRRLLENEPVQHHESYRGDQHHDGDDIELLRGMPGDGLAAVDVLLELDPLGGQLVDPGEDHHRDEPDPEERDQQLAGPVGHVQEIEGDLADLQQQPGQHQVGAGDADDVAAP